MSAGKANKFETKGRVIDAVKNGFYVELLEYPEMDPVLARLGGRIRKNNIRIVAGDEVTVELDAADLSKGRITYRW